MIRILTLTLELALLAIGMMAVAGGLQALQHPDVENYVAVALSLVATCCGALATVLWRMSR